MAEMTWRTEDLTLTLSTTPQRGYQQVVVAATRGGFSAVRNSWLDDGDIQRFADQVHTIWQNLAGTAELVGEHGVEFSIRLTTGTGGHVDVDVTINEAWGNLQLEARTDQTFLPPLRDGLLSLC
jgi:hypothetical protein